MISLDMINILMEKGGLSKQQAQSATAEACVKLFMDDDGKLLLEETQRQLNDIVKEARKSLSTLREKNWELQVKIQSMSDYVLAVKDAENKYGKVESDKAKEVLALFGSLMSIVDKTKTDDKYKLECISYVMWAYLGGKSRGNVEAIFNDRDKPTTTNYTGEMP